jgi:hypothetical protein
MHMRTPSESDLAWELLDNVRPHLSDLEVNTVAIQLSSCEFFEVIAALLAVTARANAVVRDDLAERLAQWVRRYDGHPGQARVAYLLTRQSNRDPLARRSTASVRRLA